MVKFFISKYIFVCSMSKRQSCCISDVFLRVPVSEARGACDSLLIIRTRCDTASKSSGRIFSLSYCTVPSNLSAVDPQ